MRGFSNSVLSWLDRERLEEELSNLSRLRQLTDRKRMALDEGAQTAQARHGARWSAVKLF